MRTESESDDTTCDYCGTADLAYELNSDRGPVARCIPCLAIERGQSQINMRFERFVDFEADTVVYESADELREARKDSFEACKSWWRVLARWRQDDPLVERDPDDHGPTLHEWVREFLVNLMGAAAHYPPSEIIAADGDPAQTTLEGSEE